jgi:hypothetical protein
METIDYESHLCYERLTRNRHKEFSWVSEPQNRPNENWRGRALLKAVVERCIHKTGVKKALECRPGD